MFIRLILTGALLAGLAACVQPEPEPEPIILAPTTAALAAPVVTLT